MVFKQLHNLDVREEEFIPYGGMGEDRFLGGVADKYSVQGYDPAMAKALFFDIYINTFAKPEQQIGYPGERAGCEPPAEGVVGRRHSSPGLTSNVTSNVPAACVLRALSAGC